MDRTIITLLYRSGVRVLLASCLGVLSSVSVLPAQEAPSDDAAAQGQPSQTEQQGGGEGGQDGAAADEQAQPQEQPAIKDLFTRVTERAKMLAQSPYEPANVELPGAFQNLNFDQYRNIRFRADAAIWRGETLFEVQLFHPGFLYRQPVTINVVEEGQIRSVPFDTSLFAYGDNVTQPEGASPAIGFAGMRLHFPLNRADYKDEFIAFLGASYFRVVGRDEVYGLSARGLAVDTALPEGEEFPRFSEFWLVKPAPEATTVTVYALLDSESITGAYRFDIAPGKETVIDVEKRLFARQDIAKLGVAPLTSMFFYGENRVRFLDDFRPEVHDSDGLLMHTSSDEWIWRPLTNGRELQVTSLVDNKAGAFGLVQRDREFANYLDLGLRYDKRPSIWVEPLGGDWGKGEVQLVEIPTQNEVNDNIVAFWAPQKPFLAGESRTFSYRMRTFREALPEQDVARVKRTRIGWADIHGRRDDIPPGVRRFVIDFEGDALASLAEGLPVTPELSNSTGSVAGLAAYRLPNDEGWRAVFELTPQDEEPSDMRLYLSLWGQRLTETWSYVWNPNAIEE